MPVPPHEPAPRRAVGLAILVAALGYFVDIYDLILFSIVRVSSLRSLGVPPEERAAAASVTNVPRSLAAATTPFLAGLFLEHSTFGWPLVLGGLCKILYDVLLLVLFRAKKLEAELGIHASAGVGG